MFGEILGNEKIVVTVSSGTIRCMLEDESGESEVGDEFLGDKKAFLSAVVNVKWKSVITFDTLTNVVK